MAERRFRKTQQRKIILEELQKSRKHPTALEIYDAVRIQLPKISIGTVYRNLEVLQEMGLIKRIHTGDSQMHFDSNVEDHNHIRCLKCGKVRDISIEPFVEYNQDGNDFKGFDVIGHNIEFVGLCPECKTTNDKFKSHRR